MSTLLQARRHVLKSGPAEVRASTEDTSRGRAGEGVIPPLVRGVRGISPEIFFIYGCLYVRFLFDLGQNFSRLGLIFEQAALAYP